MNRLAYIFILIIAAVIGFYAAWLVPIYGQPYIGCGEYSFLSLDPHCGAWPESLRNVLLVVPTAILVRTIPLLLGYGTAVIILGSMGGLAGLRFGDHLLFFSEPSTITNNLYFQLIPSICAVVTLLVGYLLNRAYIKNSVQRNTVG